MGNCLTTQIKASGQYSVENNSAQLLSVITEKDYIQYIKSKKPIKQEISIQTDNEFQSIIPIEVNDNPKVPKILIHKSETVSTQTIDQQQTISLDIDQVTRSRRPDMLKLEKIVVLWKNVTSIDNLCRLFYKTGTNSLERVWLLYQWIINNSDESENIPNLFFLCCQKMNIQCKIVSGYIRSLDENKNSDPTHHKWNSVFIEECWHLLDIVTEMFYEDSQNFYFLPSPDHLIFSHYPNEAKWQLLKTPLTYEQYLSLPRISASYFLLDMHLISPIEGILNSNESITQVILSSPLSHTLQVFCCLQHDSDKYPDRHTFVNYDLDTHQFQFFVSPPMIGNYEFVIFARDSNETEEEDYQWIIKYHLNVIQMRTHCQTFPTVYPQFSKSHCALYEPLSEYVQKGETIRIHMRIPNARRVRIDVEEQRIMMTSNEYKNDILSKTITVTGNIRILAKFKDNADLLRPLCKFIAQ
ncbi:unnamed protein product [Didymodactylos carnosus]|uniref:KY-like immunoglobulin-like domain-containing protein n=1 Tax=Didymodactylos carnosus TaxID=1234261 RepID=A0A814VA04_9BILA|nr:unnamed protein product [Didymodactylos carnosus]CAF1185216.1 unnamed protein product [Didymodactylos carnosus]CAF3496446.1 unnamed protein product [Didymodactylos carnosus]CAF3949545.1 unnamed protein product [Didymodactylos carnosus]